MKLTEQISNDIKEAMKAREKVKLEALRAVKTAFTLAKTSADAILSDDEELKILQKLVKQRKESAGIYESQGRTDLAEKEAQEASFIEVYLPAMMSAEELETALKTIIEKVGASSPSDMGKVMGIATKELTGKADGKEIASKVKELLSK
ncbi:MAG: GatB/YqeY domain-containing protein [Bacteroidales bacterium]|nr:GatB/YqeY domain-containing protein [Bacteroidales bacterium]MBN2821375.1 GatB/YqeY domain-containing protein [Bacteroidales bacterium]